MAIHIITIWSQEKNFGKSINEAIERLNPDDNDWILHRDSDSCFLTSDWGNQLEELIKTNDYDLIGCMTNRLREPHQTVPNMFHVMDMKQHYDKAIEIQSNEIVPFNYDVAGMFMLFRVSAWKNNKFKENTPLFDRIFTRGIKRGRVGLATGLYVLHLYRIWSNDPKNDSKHLFK